MKTISRIVTFLALAAYKPPASVPASVCVGYYPPSGHFCVDFRLGDRHRAIRVIGTAWNRRKLRALLNATAYGLQREVRLLDQGFASLDQVVGLIKDRQCRGVTHE